MGKRKKSKKQKAVYRTFDPHGDANTMPDEWEFGSVETESVEPEPVTRAQRIYFLWLVLWNAQENIKRSNKYTMSAHIDHALKERNRLALPFRQGMSIKDRVFEMGGIVKAAMVEEEA